jgi:hypothetical protein
VASFESVVAEQFPGALREPEFVERSSRLLMEERGFLPTNTLACVGVCRDELSRTLPYAVQAVWGSPFTFSALAGLLFAGRTGFGAARSHAPIEDGRERYVFFVATHIGIGSDGELGACDRIGRPGRSHACGALCAFLGELESGRLDLRTDPVDIEQSLLKQRLLRELSFGRLPSLVDLTRAAYRAIVDDLEILIGQTLDPTEDDWAVLTGVQIHGVGNEPWFWPGTCYSMVENRRQEIRFD